MNEWVTGELASVDFSDKRLDKRMRIILDRVGSKPGGSRDRFQTCLYCRRPARDGMRPLGPIAFSTMEK